MSYKSKFGITKIRHRKNGTDELDINWDTDCDPSSNSKTNRIPVFLYTPDMRDTDTHFHVPLTRAEAKRLRNWLNDYLKDVVPKKRRKAQKRKSPRSFKNCIN